MVIAAALVAGVSMAAQQPSLPPDARVGLRAGLRDAAVAARHLELVATVPRPEGFFDPRASVTPPVPDAAGAAPAGSGAVAGRGARGRGGSPLAFANSDFAVLGTTLFLGNFNGFTAYSIEDPRQPQLRAAVVCPGGQGDVSVHGRLLFMSVEETRGRIDCGTGGAAGPSNPERFRGIRIFDITDVRAPKQLAVVQTCRGSHTHTLVTDPKNPTRLYLYGSGAANVRSADELAGCSNKKPEEDPETALYSIDVIEVPLDRPEQARIVNRPRIFADSATGAIDGLSRGGTQGTGAQTASATTHCHDITAYPAIGLATGACAGNGVLLDISDPVHPVRIDQATDPNFGYWHSATFNHDGTKVIFTDEWGGGTQPRCRATDRPNWGGNAIFDIVNRKLNFRAYYKLPAAQTDVENCVAHNGSIVPVPGRDILVQAWYQGGISVFDFTDSTRPFEIAYFDRGPVNGSRVIIAGHWSAYWHNGHIYASEMVRGLDVLRLLPSDFLSRHEIEAASLVHSAELNTQQQTPLTWPPAIIVARAYVDQLRRTGVLAVSRLQQLATLFDRFDAAAATGRRPDEGLKQAAARLLGELNQDASGADARQAHRLRGIAEVLRTQAGVPTPAVIPVQVPAAR